jgi:acyl-CoA synthetase (AMP-forming)/AMP-acid ligase II
VLNVRDALRRAAMWNADRTAIVSGSRKLTFREAWDRGLRLANALLDLGLTPGDRVAVLEDNCVEASDFFLAMAAANLVRVPLYKRNSADAHVQMIRQTGCRAVVVAQTYLDELSGIKAAAPELEHIVVRGPEYEDWLSRYPNSDPNPTISSDDFYVIRHSGGTTGRSKGMAFSHRAWMETERDWTYRLPPIEVGDACTHVAPISHGSGYLFVPLWIQGGYNILEPKFDASRVLQLLSEHGGFFFAVPTMLSDIVSLASNERFDFHKLKAIAVAGAPIRQQTALAARALFGERLHQFYGQTEAVPATWMTPREWFGAIPGSEPLDSVGRVMPFAKLEIRDEENRPVAAGTSGEVALQVSGQLEKIWGEPEMTAQRLVDGWVLTGDIGRLDENGYLYLVDRKDDLIISGGFNIWPAELEIAISSIPEVREVVVVSAPHSRWGETPVAIVVLHEGKHVSEEAIIQICVDRLGGYKKPSTVQFRSDLLPRTAVGKISRKQLREDFWKGVSTRIGGV